MKKKYAIDWIIWCAIFFGMLLVFAGCSKKESPSTDTSAQSSSSNPATPGSSQSPNTGSVPGQQASEQPKAAPAPPPPPPPPRKYTFPLESKINVRTITGLSTKTAKTGDPFEATLNEAIVVDDWVVAKKNASVKGVVTDSDPGGRVKGVASLSVALKSLTLADGRVIEFPTTPLKVEARTTKKKDAAKVGVGAGVGAAIGAIAGGGKGAAIGAGVGGAAGGAAVLATHGEPASIPSESKLSFSLSQPVTVTEKTK
jgi:hypothetical protein